MTVSTLRPDSTTFMNGALTGAATSHAALSDDSDASYLTFSGYNQNWQGGFADLTLPSGAVVKAVAIRHRTALVSGATTCDARLYSAPVDFHNDPTVNWGVPTTVTAVTYSAASLSKAIVDAGALTITAYGSPVNMRLYEAYVDVTYVAKPTLVVNLPTGTVTDTNRPTVSWTSTLDSDGGPQTYYAVRIYNDAQYLAGGFTLDSTPFAHSGDAATFYVIASSDTTWQVEDILPDDTYRAYVAAAQTVNGQWHFSDWTYSEFIVNVALPGVPTLTATADNANARITLAVTDVPSATTSTDGFELQRSLDAGTTWESVRTVDGDGAVDVPWVAAVGEFSSAADATTHALVLPAPTGGILADDLLIAVVGMDGNPTLSWPTGWTEIKDEAGNGSAVRAGVAWLRAVGGESGTITLTTSASEGGGARILCVRNASTTTAPEVSTGVSSSAANANPDSLNPANWATENTLWIAAMCLDGNVAVTAGPSGYYEFGNTRWANASGAGVATASLLSVAASADPGAFTHTLEDSRAFTIGVRPRNATLTTYDYEAPNGTTMSYRARSLHDYSGVIAASAWASDTEAWTSTSWWLKHPSRPDLNVAVTIRSLASKTRAGRQGVFQPLGSTYAIIVSDTRGPNTGQVTLRSLTQAAQDSLDALLDEVATLMLQSPAGQGGPDYVRFGNHERARIVEGIADAAKVWEVLEFTEVAQPSGDVVAWP